jgi:hypothetical protein
MRAHILATSLAAVTAVAGLTAAAQPTGHAPPARHAGGGDGPVTVKGPHLYDPRTGTLLPKASSVTVSQAAGLVNQVVHMSWAHVTPSSTTSYTPTGTLYPVMVAQCKDTDPASAADCYGAENGGVTGGSGPFGPMNTVYATTTAKGTGQADIEILTVQQNTFLGCGQHHPCSLVVVPAQGGNVVASPPKCADHSEDRFTATGMVDFSANFNACSWAKRIVIPLRFAPAPPACPVRRPAFTAAGSPMLARAMDSWVTRLCAGPHGLAIQASTQVPEPLAVGDAVHGLTDVALTTRPASADGFPGLRHRFVYAPIAISATSIAYWIDDPVSGQPVTGVRLSQRLAAKLLTQSYNFQDEGRGCTAPPPPQGIGCDHGIKRTSPVTLFADPEFRRLNPGVQPVAGLGAAFQIPTVVSGHSDNTWTVTRWIAASGAARAFLRGAPDPYGMTVNGWFRGLRYPVDASIAMDPYPVIAHRFNPVFPLGRVAFYQVSNWDPGTSWEKDQFGNFPPDPIQPPGQRALIAILDQASAAAFLFPVAAIPNGAGAYTRPANAAMAAAVTTMIPAGSGTLQVDLHSTNPAVYPLTMVIYAMAPIRGLSHAKAAAIARFIDYAAGAGQVPGLRAGQLPRGYLPLTPKLAAQARTAAAEILHQSGTPAP